VPCIPKSQALQCLFQQAASRVSTISDAFYAGMSLVTQREDAWIVGPGRVLGELYLPLVLR